MREQHSADSLPGRVRSNGDICEVSCVAMRLEQDEANNVLIYFCSPYLTRTETAGSNGGCLRDELEAREGGVARPGRFVDCLKPRGLAGSAGADDR